MSRGPGKSFWIAEADKLLDDGEWHDGVEFVREAKKKITPGVARRHAERVRLQQSARRRGVPKEQVPDRVRPLSVDAQIASGKNAMMRNLMHDRVRFKIWEVTPWPIPVESWRGGGWKIRKLERYTPHQLARVYHVEPAALRRLILADPPVPYRDTGSGRLQVTAEALPELERRIEEYKRQTNERRRVGASVRWGRYNAGERTHVSLTELGIQSKIGRVTAVRLAEEHPELGWQRVGQRILRLPLDRIPAWEKVVAEYKASDGGQLGERRAERRRANQNDAE